MRIRLSLLLFQLICCANLFAQTPVKGMIKDAGQNQPLAFASVLIKETKLGTLTDIDGKFTLQKIPAGQFTLVISHIGYKSKEIKYSKAENVPSIIFIESTSGQLEDVVIEATENPAHRIIRLVQQNKDKNDPERLNSFRYNGYTVAALGSGNYIWNAKPADSAKVKRRKEKAEKETKKDTSKTNREAMIMNRFRENYLLVSESYTERIFRYPKQSKETVLAVKVSGMKAASFAFTAAVFQPFGFYKDNILMLGLSYINPIEKHSIAIYRFRLLQVQPHEHDTTFVISFEPRKNKNFNGLKGVLYINSENYAIENVTAAAANEKGMAMRFKLQQKYEREAGYWFPVQLNSTVMQMTPASDSVLMYWDSRSYMSNIKIGEQFSARNFSDVTLKYLPDAGFKTEKEWSMLRQDSLREKEKATYETYTLLPAKARKVIQSANGIMEALFLEAVPYHKIDIPFKYFLNGFNKYERVRLGAGFQTNPRLSNFISVGGFAGYGIKDKAWKYGGNIQLNLNERTAAKIQLSYSRDLNEPGTIPFFVKQSSVLSNQNLRTAYISRMDSVKQFELKFSINLRPRIQTQLWLLNEERNPAGYSYLYKNDGTNTTFRRFTNTEAGIGLRFTNGEIFTSVGRAKRKSMPATTELLVQLSKGMDVFLKGELDYTKTAIRLTHRFNLKRLGQTTVQIEAAKIWGNVPYSYLFNTKACKTDRPVTVYIPNSFQTAGLYEFASDQSAALFFQHSFGNLLFKPANVHFRPEPVLVHNMTYGSLKNRGNHQEINFLTPSKGLYESGLLVNNIYRKKIFFTYLGFGTGAFYRYGYYHLPKAIDNWAFKISINFSL